MAMKPIYNINILVKGKNMNELISIEKLIIHHSSSLNIHQNIETLAKSNIRDDFVSVSIMMGNDYLPKVAYVQYENLWKTFYNFMRGRQDNLMENNTINTHIFQLFIYLLFKNLSPGFRKPVILNDNFVRAKSYLEGLVWCLNMYRTGVCSMYDYMYSDGDKSPHPYELLLYLSSLKGESVKILSSQTESILSNIYPLIIMPKGGSYLLNEKYRKLMENELKYLYDTEECSNCIDSRKQLNELTKKKINCKDKDSNDYKELKKLYSEKYKKHIEHKKTHYNSFNLNDINKIIKYASN